MPIKKEIRFAFLIRFTVILLRIKQQINPNLVFVFMLILYGVSIQKREREKQDEFIIYRVWINIVKNLLSIIVMLSLHLVCCVDFFSDSWSIQYQLLGATESGDSKYFKTSSIFIILLIFLKIWLLTCIDCFELHTVKVCNAPKLKKPEKS